MDFEWKTKINYNSQPSIGFLETYESLVGIKKHDNFKVRAEVLFYPPHLHQIADVTLFFEGDKLELTDALSSSIRYDLSEIIRKRELEIYPKESPVMRVFMLKVYTCNKLPEIELYSHGDMGFTDQLN